MSQDYSKLLNLVLSGDESISKEFRGNIFTGEWCVSPFYPSFDNLDDFSFLKYHWNDRQKLCSDHEYLKELYERVLEELSAELGKIHDVSPDKEYWRIVIGPWLIHYLAVFFDRWSVLDELNNLAYQFKTEVILDNQRDPAIHYHDSLLKFENQEWNHKLFSSILIYRNFKNVKLFYGENRSSPTIEDVTKDSFNFKQILSEKILKIYDAFAEYFNKFIFRNDQFITLYHTYFPRLFQLNLGLRLRVLPRQFEIFNTKIKPNKDIWNKDLLTNFNHQNSFEKFLSERIFIDIPRSYLEDFKELHSIQTKATKTNVIFTSNAHLNNDLFKIWMAECKQNNSKIIVSAHGGGIYPKYSVFDHQEKISHKRIVWGKEWLDNQLRLPPNKLYFKNWKFRRDSYITLVCFSGSIYTLRLTAQPMGSCQIKELLFQWKEFSDLLNADCRHDLRIKSLPGLKIGRDALDETKLGYYFGSKNVITNQNFTSVIKKSKISICTYPQTTFSESIFSGIPTLLLIKEDFFEVEEIYHQLIEILKDAKIYHTCPISAAKHVNQIYEDPNIWWNSKICIEARNAYMEVCLTNEKNPAKVWSSFFKKYQ